MGATLSVKLGTVVTSWENERAKQGGKAKQFRVDG